VDQGRFRNACTTPSWQPPSLGAILARSKRPAISLPENHPMVVLTDTVDWTEMEMRAEKRFARKKLKKRARAAPQLRADA